MFKRAFGWISLLAITLGIGCSVGPLQLQDPNDGIVVSGDIKAFLPKSPPGICVGSNGGLLMNYNSREGQEASPSRPRLMFQVTPFPLAASRFTMGDGNTPPVNAARLSTGNYFWESVSGSLAVSGVHNYLVSGTLNIAYWKHVDGALSMAGAWSCNVLD